MRLASWMPVVAVFWVASGCDVYHDRLKGEFSAGSADPVNFPPPYRGVGATRNIAGSGSGITAARAFVGGNAVGYYLFPYGTSQLVTPGYSYSAATIANQTRTATTIGSVPMPLAYVFDPPATGGPFGAPQCKSDPNYRYDAQRDEVNYAEPGNIFTALPNAAFNQGSLPTWTYVPIVREVAVSSNGEACQDIKSERTLLTRGDVTFPKDDSGSGSPDGKYLAWALIDPGSGVYRLGETPARSTGVGVQHWGWFQQFLVAYIDGGYIPLASGTQFKTQKLFIPRTRVTATVSCGIPPVTCASGQVCVANSCRACTSTGAAACPTGQTCASGICSANGTLGAGYDVLEFARSDASYSPICQVTTYNTATNPIPIESLPKNASTISSNPGAFDPQPPADPPAGSIAPGTTIPPYVFCLQAQ